MKKLALVATVNLGLVAIVLIAGCSFQGHGDPNDLPDASMTIDGDHDADADPDADAPSSLSSCTALASTCGPNGTDNCCESSTIPGGSFLRSYDGDEMVDMGYPATIGPFVLDKYEVTVGRFRAFINAGKGTRTSAPTSGAGARTINGSTQGGWDASWNIELATSTAMLKTELRCDTTHQTWTDTVGGNEALPINCITWYEAMAFCLWDGGHLPTEAEWNYAASGGSEQRVYPWSVPPSSEAIDCSYTNYNVDSPSGTYCANGTTGATTRVGSESPKGDGKWGQADLAGNVWEWSLDWYASSYPTNTCSDCANLDPGGACPVCPTRVVRGGSFTRSTNNLRAGGRGFSVPDHRSSEFGVRCAR